MLEQYEKKVNKMLLDFVIGGSYMGDYGRHFAEDVRNFFVAMYDHLLEQWAKLKKWYEEE